MANEAGGQWWEGLEANGRILPSFSFVKFHISHVRYRRQQCVEANLREKERVRNRQIPPLSS